MWLCLNDAFLSVVQPKGFDLPKAARKLRDPLMVRARRRDDLIRHFPKAHVYNWKGRDYPFRVIVERQAVQQAMTKALGRVTYSNFKNSVRDDERHDAYMGIWSTMMRWSQGGFKRKPWNPAAQQQFAWGRGESERELFAGWPKDDLYGVDDDEPCTTPGCTIDQPCMNCLTDAIQAAHEDRYGDFDSGDERDDDAGAKSHLRVVPR